MSSQISTRLIKISTIMRSAAFMRGFNEARKGAPMDYDAYNLAQETSKRWNYERGRQFGLVYNGAVKDGAKVKNDAIRSWIYFREKKWVC